MDGLDKKHVVNYKHTKGKTPDGARSLSREEKDTEQKPKRNTAGMGKRRKKVNLFHVLDID